MFTIGWAAVQIAHLTMLNCLTNDQNERVLLVSLRYFFSSVGDISTFMMSYLLLQGEQISTPERVSKTNRTVPGNWTELSTMFSNGTDMDTPIVTQDAITIEDMPLFRNIAVVLTVYGLLFVIAFHCGVPERRDQIDSNDKEPDLIADDMIRSVPEFIKSLDELHSIASQMHEVGRSRHNSISGSALHMVRTKQLPSSLKQLDIPIIETTEFNWYDWFRVPRFWVDCFIFTTIRLSVTLSSLYISPFLLRTLKLDKSSIMLVPLAIYCTSLVTSLLQHRVVKLLGRLGNSMIGVIFTLSFCTILFFYVPGQASQLMVYCAAILLGVGAAFNNVSAIVVVTDMIQPHQTNTAAFVHGFASLTDKVFTGVTVQIIQLSLHWIDYRHVEVFIVGGLLLIGGSLSVFDYLYWIRPNNRNKDDASDFESEPLRGDCEKSPMTNFSTLGASMPIAETTKEHATNGYSNGKV
ncbi:unnamed protein product [Echinostoma caproni]|uniref:MFS domain-containing protein n=1 Tax=Echinostoma caproni TaxID=27848 RepID=A0A183A5M3_9TREM|nr:unnamed protein product [Echinostoma caproni]